MTIVVPVPITPAGLPLPDPADRATFSERKLEQLRWANNEYSTGSKALADASYSNASDAQISATTSAANAASAVAAAGVTKWVYLTNYAQGVSVWSPTSFLTYRAKTAGVSNTDPALDPTNWQVLSPLLNVVHESTTARTAGASEDVWLENAAASVVTANPAPFDLEEFAVTPANSKLTNSINFGAATVQGPMGSTTGTLTLNLGTRMRFRYSATLVKWIIL